MNAAPPPLADGQVWTGAERARQIVGILQDRIFYRCLYVRSAARPREAPKHARCCTVKTFAAWMKRERATLFNPKPFAQSEVC